VSHGGRPPLWGHWRTVEGGWLIDRQALYEAYLVATAAVPSDDPALPERAAARQAAAPSERRAALAELTDVAVTLLDAGRESCRHGMPIGLDLSVPQPFEPIAGLTVAGDGPATGQPLRILAGPVWGAGNMPWTRALLEAVQRYVRPGDFLADVGTGSGILGLYAARRGAAVVDAVDTDRLAVAVAARNARANHLDDRVRARHGSTELLQGHYDVGIVSLGNVAELPPVLGATLARIRPGGILVASPAHGPTERDALARLLRELGVEPFDLLEREEWSVWAGRAA
jgi:ribosomal protein L11 methylase PrmA